ncbi:MAG: gliding motility-associated C-terminal domain-containing protein [Phycisphaerae bacterium]|nr:gliding motility-associated C-terminal domain-containing protein [Saprospiraceae bacterium]
MADILEMGDIAFCTIDSLTLNATAQNGTYLWNTGNTGPIQKVAPGTTGYFSVKICDPDLCVGRDTVFVALANQLSIEIGPADTLILQGNNLFLGGNHPDLQYQWNTGSTSTSITVLELGNYAVTVTDESGCTASGAISIETLGMTHIYVPNVFSPNDDGQNDWVTVFADQGVQLVLTFQIFDRWGELVFRREDFAPNQENNGWNGYFRGKRADTNVYTWLAQVEYLNGTVEVFKGDLTVVR